MSAPAAPADRTRPAPSGDPRYVPGLDAVRALGAAAVVGTHCAFWTGRSVHGPFSGVLARLDVGVALFFVLSGFLLFRPFVVAHLRGGAWPGTRAYLARRAVRILPAYWVLVVVALLALAENRDSGRPWQWLRQLTLTQVYEPNGQGAGLTHIWSLATEAAFYLVLPLLAALALRCCRQPVWALAGLMALSPLWWVALSLPGGLDPQAADLWLPGYLDWFGAGMLLALVQVQATVSTPTGWRLGLRQLAAAPGTCWALALVGLALATSTLAGPPDLTTPTGAEHVVKNLLYAGIAVLVVLPLTLRPATGSPVDRALGSRPVRWLGEVSYGVFLWHLLLLHALTTLRHQALFTGSWLTTFVLVWLASVGVASLSYLLLERPLLRLLASRLLASRLRSRSLRARSRGRVLPPASIDQVAASPTTQSA